VHAVAISSLIYEKVLEKWHPSIYNLIWLAMTNVRKRHSHLVSIAPEKIVEIGCGGGRNKGVISEG